MIRDVMIFLLGGYFLPAVYFGWHVWRAECLDDDPESSTFATVIWAALSWPVSPLIAEPADEDF